MALHPSFSSRGHRADRWFADAGCKLESAVEEANSKAVGSALSVVLLAEVHRLRNYTFALVRGSQRFLAQVREILCTLEAACCNGGKWDCCSRWKWVPSYHAELPGNCSAGKALERTCLCRAHPANRFGTGYQLSLTPKSVHDILTWSLRLSNLAVPPGYKS